MSNIIHPETTNPRFIFSGDSKYFFFSLDTQMLITIVHKQHLMLFHF